MDGSQLLMLGVALWFGVPLPRSVMEGYKSFIFNSDIFKISECLSADVGTNGLGPCMKTSGAKRGSININFPVAAQTAVVGIVRSPNERITLRCSEMTAVNAFTVSYTLP